VLSSALDFCPLSAIVVDLTPGAELDATAGEDCRVGVEVADGIDGLPFWRIPIALMSVRNRSRCDWWSCGVDVGEGFRVPREPLQALELGADRLHVSGRCAQIDQLIAQHGMHRVEKGDREFASTKVPLTDERVEQQDRGMAAGSRVPPQGAQIPAILISKRGMGSRVQVSI
jgi:hypothetical protein